MNHTLLFYTHFIMLLSVLLLVIITDEIQRAIGIRQSVKNILNIRVTFSTNKI